jgi:dTDP-4-amino-4,6-dideoxygalactose transaminase
MDTEQSPTSWRIYYTGIRLGLREVGSVFSPRTTESSLRMFSESFSKQMGGGQSFLVSQGRAAILAALKAFDIGVGDEVLLQSFVCPAVVDAIVSSGAKPVLLDLEDGFWTTNVESVKESISPKTKAVLVVHTYGQPSDLDSILEVSKDHNLRVIEDCAQALGGEYRGRPLGSIGDAAIFSSGVDKPLSTGAGGILYTADKDVAGRISKIVAGLPIRTLKDRAYVARKITSDFILTKPSLRSAMQRVFHIRNKVATDLLGQNQISPSFAPSMVALKPMTREAALFGLPQLGNIKSSVRKRNENARTLDMGLKGLGLIELPRVRGESVHAFTTYPIKIVGKNPKETRERINASLHNRGIYAGNIIWQVAIHRRPQYQSLMNADQKKAFPITDDFVDSFINLPVHPALGEVDLHDIVEAVKSVV